MSLASVGHGALMQLVDNAQDGVALFEAPGSRPTYVNSAGQRVLGLVAADAATTDRALAELLERVRGVSKDGPVTVLHQGRQLECTLSQVVDGPKTLEVMRFSDVTTARLQEERLKTFSRTSASIAFAESLAVNLDRLAHDVRRTTGMDSCTFVLIGDDGEMQQCGTSGSYPHTRDYVTRLAACQALGAPLLSKPALATRQPIVVDGWREQTLRDPRFGPLHPISRDATWHTIAVFPLIVRNATVGVLDAFFPKGRRPSDADITFLSAIADQAAIAVDNSRMVVQLEERAALDERHRLARDLHDSVNQALFSMSLQARTLELVASEPSPDPDAFRRGATEIHALAKGALAEMRALIFQLRPEALHAEGLVSAVRRQAAALAARDDIRVDVEDPDGLAGLPPEVEVELFRVVVESLTNVVKHANAKSARISFTRSGRDLSVTIRDDGKGFDPADPHAGHLGLISMRERLDRVGGRLRVESAPGGPTKVHATVAGALS
ncbi:PAS domain-containing sensor histidine kinase [Amycolatopsis silviterrae]|uniref:Histidine kinase n=1 Tax=Amycolatopsis silviterrae TaxID=1656914 RepID=A0ABW5HKT6_9PSEU